MLDSFCTLLRFIHLYTKELQNRHPVRWAGHSSWYLEESSTWNMGLDIDRSIILTLSGTLLKKNDHRPCRRHSSLSLSRSKSSPIGIPQPASSHS